MKALAESRSHFDAMPLTNVRTNTYVSRRFLQLNHNHVYYVTVIAQDEASQCIASESASILVDLTPPVAGNINIGGISNNVQYIHSRDTLHVQWDGFHDPESGIGVLFASIWR
jgi:hypothetical protein